MGERDGAGPAAHGHAGAARHRNQRRASPGRSSLAVGTDRRSSRRRVRNANFAGGSSLGVRQGLPDLRRACCRDQGFAESEVPRDATGNGVISEAFGRRRSCTLIDARARTRSRGTHRPASPVLAPLITPEFAIPVWGRTGVSEIGRTAPDRCSIAVFFSALYTLRQGNATAPCRRWTTPSASPTNAAAARGRASRLAARLSRESQDLAGLSDITAGFHNF